MKEVYAKNDIHIYNMDNLELLRELPDGSINLIYCDVLYNSGKSFSDYNDNLGDPLEAVEWYRPRFEEMSRVLADDGSIFIHCNWRLDSYLRILMDEIFGINNFRNRIYRKHSELRGFYKNFDSQVDVILYYVKDAEKFTFNDRVSSTKTQLYPLFEDGYIEGRGEVRTIKGKSVNLASKNKHWLVSQEKLDEIQKDELVQIMNGLPYRRSKVVQMGNLWDGNDMLDKFSRTDGAEGYDTPKPDAVLESIIMRCSNRGDVVADFFLGGGTTAVVAKKLGRKGIFCDINPKACEVTISKLNRV